MKRLIIAAALFVTAIPAFAQVNQYTNGYERQNGTYVQGYNHTAPDANKADNYSTRGNVNPYTGQPGYKNPY